MRIRLATPEDASRIARVHVEAWQAAYRGIVPQEHLDGLSVSEREQRWKDWIGDHNPGILVAEDTSGVVGWISFGRARDDAAGPGVGEVYALYVSPRRWASGVGRALWLEAKQNLTEGGFREVVVWVLSANQRARRFYEAVGLQLRAGAEKVVEIGGRPLPEVQHVMEVGQNAPVTGVQPMEIQLRDAVEADSAFVFNAFREALGPYVELMRVWDDELERERHTARWGRQRFRIIVADGADVGYVSTSIHRQPTDDRPAGFHLHQLMVLPAFQSKGIGSVCVGRLVAEARALELPLHLRVLRVNPRALEFYRRAGCEVVGESESHTFLRCVE